MRVREQCILLLETYKDCRRTWDLDGIGGVRINQSLLTTAATRYVHDIDRLKQLDDVGASERAKQACYMAKWILRMRPVYFELSGQHADTAHSFLNETFALRAIFASLGLRLSSLHHRFRQLLLYTFHYKQFEEDSFLPCLELLGWIARQDPYRPMLIGAPAR